MTGGLWQSSVVEKITGGRCVGGPWVAQGISFDSRLTRPGDLFLALNGGERDGHDFVAGAFINGAVVAVVEKIPENNKGEGSFLLVDNVYEALQDLALESRVRAPATIVAVTGSVGKTSTKDALAAALSKSCKVHSTSGNLNNHIGLPLSLARMPKETKFGVFELGMNHSGEIRHLSNLIKPELAIITNVNSVHLEHFENEQGIAEAKAEIFQGMSSDGQVILYSDNRWSQFLTSKAREAGIKNIITFGSDASCAVRISNCEINQNGSLIEIEVSGKTIRYTLDVVGKHIAINTVGVIACINALGCDIDSAIDSFRSICLGRGRGKHIGIPLGTVGEISLIDESYNANPIAMRAALASFGLTKLNNGGRRIAILGDMLELGPNGPFLHANLIDDLIASKPDMVVTVGSLMKNLYDKIPEGITRLHANKSSDIAEKIPQKLRVGDLILVKGSLGTNMAPIVTAIENMGLKSGLLVESHEMRG
jgi:UDP-N-acetylmuramoyl-tripeptide--D-alanyl-D-alanine ligase